MDINERYEYYSNNLSNFKTILQDTNENITHFEEEDYNCMGYALGTFEWEELSSFESVDENDFDSLEDVALACVKELNGCFDYLRRIDKPEEATEDEYVIAFRAGYDDFHFLRRTSDGIWTHKPGSGVVQNLSEEEVFGTAWAEHRYYPYISTIYYFAVRH